MFDPVFVAAGFEQLRVTRVPFYNDEPKIYQYFAELPMEGRSEPFMGYGSDLTKKAARSKAVCEVVERYCLAGVSELPILKRPLTSPPSGAVDPLLFRSFTESQEKIIKNSGSSLKAVSLSWIQGVDVIGESNVWLPTQVVLCPFDTRGEPLLRFPSSNGVACGSSLVEAQCRSVLEVIERDAFMCWYLSNSTSQRLRIEGAGCEELERLAYMYQRYRLDLVLLLLNSRWPFHVVLAFIVDRTGAGPALTAGLKCHPRLEVAALGATYEAQQIRPWLRDAIEIGGHVDLLAAEVTDYWERALFWSKPGRYKELEFLWDGAPSEKVEAQHGAVEGNSCWERVWQEIVSSVRARSFDLFYVDLSTASCDDNGVCVVKSLIPQAHPLYLDERFPYLKSKSLSDAVSSFGSRWSGRVFLPHPFA